MCIYDLMYEFHYDYIKNYYGSNSRLSFTDTGGLIYETKTKDVYEDFSKDRNVVFYQLFS